MVKTVKGGDAREKKQKASFTESERKRLWKNQMENINNENDWDHMTAATMVDGPIEKITRQEMTISIKAIKPGKVAGPSEVCAEMVFASGEVRICLMIESC